jgi:hypothetical protein
MLSPRTIRTVNGTGARRRTCPALPFAISRNPEAVEKALPE